MPSPRPLRLLALGDSYTVGEGVERDAAWPALVARRLRADGVDVDDPAVIAQTGWTTDDLQAGLEEAAPDGPFDAVTLLVGVNDQYDGRPPEAYRPRFRDLLGRAVSLAGGGAPRVVVVSIPDWGLTPFAARPREGVADRGPEQIAREVDAYNVVAREEAGRAGARWVDVTDLSRQQGPLVVADGLHPSADAYAAWADRIAPAVRAALAA